MFGIISSFSARSRPFCAIWGADLCDRIPVAHGSGTPPTADNSQAEQSTTDEDPPERLVRIELAKIEDTNQRERNFCI
jgi:hypothetical protein